LQDKITDIVCNGRTTPGRPMARGTAYWSDLSWIEPDEFQRRTDRAD
jgi:hypothetical protein